LADADALDDVAVGAEGACHGGRGD
jgi:hypothetical protein